MFLIGCISFSKKTGLINNSQFGFLKVRSTVTQLLSSLNDWAKSRNLSRPTDVDFLDLAKAFDSVPHERLLLKLKSNGIDGRLHAWLTHFLTGRRQRVFLRGTTIMDKILGTVVQFERFSTLYVSTPSPNPTDSVEIVKRQFL